MPQLDFFSFPHQFILMFSCFYTLYYFNLIILFPQVKWFYLFKYYFPKLYTCDVQLSTENCYVDTWSLFFLLVEQSLIHTERLEKKIMSFAFQNVGKKFLSKEKPYLNLTLFSLISYFLLVFLTKNNVDFNAEKLMFVYFLLLISIILTNSFKFLKFFFEKETKNFILKLTILEDEYLKWELKIVKVTQFARLVGLVFLKSNLLLSVIRVKALLNA